MAGRLPLIRDWIERSSASAFFGAVLLAVGLPLGGTWFAAGAADAALVAMSVLGAVGGLAGLQVRRRVDTLPLEVSPTVLTGPVNGKSVFRFRVRLGRGRLVHAQQAEVLWEGPEGAVELATLTVDRPVIGPWTVVAIDEQGRVDGGELVLKVRAREGNRSWDAGARWPLSGVRPGRFEAGVLRRRGRLDWDPRHWDAVVDDAQV